ncbi:MAG: hypothetical protein II458_07255 [Oscillospiraceae bacterium]|nr:hypothetical protein [Oscillospiraceae bacterium]
MTEKPRKDRQIQAKQNRPKQNEADLSQAKPSQAALTSKDKDKDNDKDKDIDKKEREKKKKREKRTRFTARLDTPDGAAPKKFSKKFVEKRKSGSKSVYMYYERLFTAADRDGRGAPDRPAPARRPRPKGTNPIENTVKATGKYWTIGRECSKI